MLMLLFINFTVVASSLLPPISVSLPAVLLRPTLALKFHYLLDSPNDGGVQLHIARRRELNHTLISSVGSANSSLLWHR